MRQTLRLGQREDSGHVCRLHLFSFKPLRDPLYRVVKSLLQQTLP